MSEPIPEAVPTSADPRSRRPVKRIRTGNANTALATQADEIEDLMWDPSRPVNLPPTSVELKSRSTMAPPPEIVANVQGSSAGAGSGEFHVYKASRRREYERLRSMDEEAKQEDDEKKWQEQEKTRKEQDDEKTRKNREKRNRRKKGGAKSGAATGGGGGPSGSTREGAAVDVDGNGTEQKASAKKGLNVPRREREESEDPSNTFAVAPVVQEIGITIHDDD